MQAGRNRLVVVDALKMLCGLEDCWVAFRSMRSMTYQVSRRRRRGNWCESVDSGEYEKEEERWEDAEADRYSHYLGQLKGAWEETVS